MALRARVGAYLVIVQDQALLTIMVRDAIGDYLTLPGGGLDTGETLREAARRETWEETGAQTEVGRLLLVWEYEPRRQRGVWGARPRLSFLFAGTLLTPPTARPPVPDDEQIGVGWLPLTDLPTAPFHPWAASRLLEAMQRDAPDPLTDLVNGR
ncbi:MAG: NUDIX domain-containing protein [Dehalococcoidia bacterium]|nr:NUDIX domain-containing protein [Dehalococcoidia bacterium]